MTATAMKTVILRDERKNGLCAGSGNTLDEALRACLWSASRSPRNNLAEMLVIKSLLHSVPCYMELSPYDDLGGSVEMHCAQYTVWIR